MARILSVSYDQSLLVSRQLILERHGYRIVSAHGFPEALKHCQSPTNFDLFIVGHSIPRVDKETLISEFRSHCSAPVVALKRFGEPRVKGADYEIERRPEAVVQLTEQIASDKRSSSRSINVWRERTQRSK